MAYMAGKPIQSFTQPQLVWNTPAAGSSTIAVKHTVGCAWLMQRGVWLQPIVDYTEDANGFYLTNITADGVENFGVFILAPINVSGMLTGNNPVITQGGLTFPDGSVISSAPMGRNRIINGDFRVNQRGGGTPAVGTGTYLVDRWYSWQGGAAGAVQVVAGNPNYGDVTQGAYVRVVGVAGNTTANFGQRIESGNISDLVGKTVTVSFTVIRTLGGPAAVAIYVPTANDNYASPPTVVGNIWSATLPVNVWQRFVVPFVMPAGAKFGLQIEWDAPTVLAGDYFALTDVQLEAGTISAPVFERRSHIENLAMCQRYYQRVAPGGRLWGMVNTAALMTFAYYPTVTMRTGPAVTLLNNAGGTVENPPWQTAVGSTGATVTGIHNTGGGGAIDFQVTYPGASPALGAAGSPATWAGGAAFDAEL